MVEVGRCGDRDDIEGFGLEHLPVSEEAVFNWDSQASPNWSRVWRSTSATATRSMLSAAQ
jgi:hypothetical protein